MFEYFYNEVFRSVIIGFGSLFNGIKIQHKDASDDTFSEIQVPLAYGPTQKFLARMQQEADLNRPVQITLPRMSFEFTGLTYDPSRKSTQMQTVINQTPDGANIKKNYMPVPYNMSFELVIYTKLNDDMLQIVEQILPYFQPHYNLSVNFLGNLKEKRDIAIQLDNIVMSDDYEGNFDTRRALIYTLNFTAKTYLFGPVTDVTDTIVKRSLLVTLLEPRRVQKEISLIRLLQEQPRITMELWSQPQQQTSILEMSLFLSQAVLELLQRLTFTSVRKKCLSHKSVETT